ncbi:MAG TPA: penicillin-binding protein activator LpoB [Desulfobacteraceae bacterium]|nr:penicillin-binding protein activator LpoB [Desulfobacteraceae bacterium]
MRKRKCLLVVLFPALMLFFGCASTGTRVQYADPGGVERLTADFGATDLHMIAEKMVGSLVESPILDGRPIILVDNIRNKTHEHIDTKAITDKIRTILLKNGRVRVTARSDIPDSLLKEQEFQSSNLADPDTLVRMGKLAGASYILFGEITSISKSYKGQRDVWFKITMNLTDVERGLIEWADDKEIRKVAKRRSMGW